VPPQLRDTKKATVSALRLAQTATPAAFIDAAPTSFRAAALPLRLEAEEDGHEIQVDLARRRLRVGGAGLALEGTALGLLQTAPRWSSTTGLVRDETSGEERGFVLIVDEAGGTVSLQVDGRAELRWTLGAASGM
jgi:hypothetical protein